MRRTTVYLNVDAGVLEPDGVPLADSFDSLKTRMMAVPVSGHTADEMTEMLPVFGPDRDCVFELGGGIMVNGRKSFTDVAPWRPIMSNDTTWTRLKDCGASANLVEWYPGRLEPHTPWDAGREVTHCFRGAVNVREANRWLRDWGLVALQLIDDGPIAPGIGTLDLAKQRVYHLAPASVSRATGVAAHQNATQTPPRASFMIGGSRIDLQAARTVNTVYIVASGVRHDPGLQAAVARIPNAILTKDGFGDGVSEALAAILRQGS